jgi:uncharacterized membrane protein YfcA
MPPTPRPARALSAWRLRLPALPLPLPALLAALLAFFLAGVVQGLTGFGSVLVVVPVLLLFLDAQTAVITTQLVVFALCVYMAVRRWRQVRLVETTIILLAAGPGIWLGALALQYWTSAAIKVVAGLAVLAAVAPLLLGIRRRVKHERLAAIPAGLIGGVLQGSTGMSGPPVVILFANQGWERQAFLGSISLYLSASTVCSLSLYNQAGLLRAQQALLAIWLLPALLLGGWLGHALAPRVDLPLFQRLICLLVLAGGASTLVSGLAALVGG